MSDTETIDRLFLELSQVTRATTAKELALKQLLAQCMPYLGREVTSQREADELNRLIASVRVGLK